jgi:hypothetical protein
MVDDERWRFHQNELKSLKSACVYAVGVCNLVRQSLKAIRDDDPNACAFPICEFLDRGGMCQSLEWRLDEIDHLISSVATAFDVPGMSVTKAGICVPTLTSKRRHKSAHHASLGLHYLFHGYFESKVFQRCPHLKLRFTPINGASELVETHWKEIRKELRAVSKFDCDALAAAIEVESRAAIEQCRSTMIDASSANGSERQLARSRKPHRRISKHVAIRQQRNKFSAPRRAKGQSWEEIYSAYIKVRKHQSDKKASPDTLRLAFTRKPSDADE